jgi:hypothetical protein
MNARVEAPGDEVERSIDRGDFEHHVPVYRALLAPRGQLAYEREGGPELAYRFERFGK